VLSRKERLREIGKIISDAMAKAGVDWAMDSPEIAVAEADLNEAMAQYVDETTSKANVRAVYQRWRDLHKAGGLF
jgi:hypothetical protein